MLTRMALLIVLIFSAIIVTAQDETMTLESDEVLDMIAASYDISTDCLIETNDIENFSPGDSLIIDPECPPYDETDTTDESVAALGQGGAINTHTVERGETLADVADLYRTSMDCLLSANTIVNPDIIYIGQELVVTADCQNPGQGGGGGADTESGPAEERCFLDRNPDRVVENGVYVVQQGDVLDFIGCDLNFSTMCLRETNNLMDLRKPILIGQELIISNECRGWEGPNASFRG